MKGDRQKCIEAGASDYVSKPVDIDQLSPVLRVWLRRPTAPNGWRAPRRSLPPRGERERAMTGSRRSCRHATPSPALHGRAAAERAASSSSTTTSATRWPPSRPCSRSGPGWSWRVPGEEALGTCWRTISPSSCSTCTCPAWTAMKPPPDPRAPAHAPYPHRVPDRRLPRRATLLQAYSAGAVDYRVQARRPLHPEVEGRGLRRPLPQIKGGGARGRASTRAAGRRIFRVRPRGYGPSSAQAEPTQRQDAILSRCHWICSSKRSMPARLLRRASCSDDGRGNHRLPYMNGLPRTPAFGISRIHPEDRDRVGRPVGRAAERRHSSIEFAGSAPTVLTRTSSIRQCCIRNGDDGPPEIHSARCRRHRATLVAIPVDPSAEDGCDRKADRRHRARFQQSAERDHRRAHALPQGGDEYEERVTNAPAPPSVVNCADLVRQLLTFARHQPHQPRG